MYSSVLNSKKMIDSNSNVSRVLWETNFSTKLNTEWNLSIKLIASNQFIPNRSSGDKNYTLHISRKLTSRFGFSLALHFPLVTYFPGSNADIYVGWTSRRRLPFGICPHVLSVFVHQLNKDLDLSISKGIHLSWESLFHSWLGKYGAVEYNGAARFTWQVKKCFS